MALTTHVPNEHHHTSMPLESTFIYGFFIIAQGYWPRKPQEPCFQAIWPCLMCSRVRVVHSLVTLTYDGASRGGGGDIHELWARCHLVRADRSVFPDLVIIVVRSAQQPILEPEKEVFIIIISRCFFNARRGGRGGRRAKK